MKNTLGISILVLTMVASVLCTAQNNRFNDRQQFRRDFANGFQLSGHVQLGLPQNEFSEVFNGYPSGAAASASIPLGRSGLFRLGAEFAWNSMGREKSAVELFNDAQGIIAGDMAVSSDVHSYHGFLRFSPFEGGFRPYFDVFAGWRTYTTDTEISYEEVDGTVISTTEEFSRDATNSYGYAAGLMIGLSRNLFFDAKVQVLRGGEVNYVDQSTLIIDAAAEINYDIRITETDMLVPQLGISLVF